MRLWPFPRHVHEWMLEAKTFQDNLFEYRRATHYLYRCTECGAFKRIRLPGNDQRIDALAIRQAEQILRG